MSLWRTVLSRIRTPFRREAIEAEMDEELRLHLEQQIHENIADGMTPEEARYAALRRFGGVDQLKELAREQRGGVWLDTLFRDVRGAIRLVKRNPVFSATAILTLALVLGANGAVFTLVSDVLLRPLSFPEPDRLVVTLNQYPSTNFGRVGASVANYFERKEGVPAFAEVAAVRFGAATIGQKVAPEYVPAGYVTASFFRLLGVRPALGRSFSDPDSTVSSDLEIVLSEAYWRRLFDADPDVLGREVRIDGMMATVVGVLPADFCYPAARADVWLPLKFSEDERSAARRHQTSVDVIARLKPNASISEAQSQVDALNERLAQDDPTRAWASEAGFHTVVTGLHDDSVAAVRPALQLLQVSAGFLLLLGTANLTNLLLARAVNRAKEFAVRRALGAGQGRIAVQFAIETLVLAIAGGLLGLWCAVVVLRGLALLEWFRLPFADEIALDVPISAAVLAGASLIAMTAALPAMGYVLGCKLPWGIGGGSPAETGRRPIQRFQQILMVTQVALAFVLLAITGLLSVSLQRVLAIKPGFQADHVMTAAFSLPKARYGTPTQRLGLTERLLAELDAKPEVKVAGLATAMPFASVGGTAVTVDGNPDVTAGNSSTHYLSLVGGDLFEALRIPLHAGRLLDSADGRRAERVCVVDEVFARTYWPGRSPLGYRVFDGETRSPEDNGATIVGVVGEVQEGDPTARLAKGKVYYALAEDWAPPYLYLAVRSEHDADARIMVMRAALAAVDPELALFDVQSLSARLSESRTARRAPLRVSAPFAGVATILSIIGVYGLVAYDVARREREIGIRMALGADRGRIVVFFLSVSGRVWLAGILIGVSVTMSVGRLLQSVLYGVAANSVWVLIASAVLLGAAVLAAGALPAWRASRTSPSSALRRE